MKLFISHSSADKAFGNSLVELLRGIGVKDDEIIFTSNTAYGIPTGANIFNLLKSQISEKPFVIYLLSKEYYSSVACLNEMGAAWVIENEHAILFTPNFDISSKEFQNGAVDPRELGFYIDNEERLLLFVKHLEKSFCLSKNPVIIHQNLKKYLKEIELITQRTEPENIRNKSKLTATPKQKVFAIEENKQLNEVEISEFHQVEPKKKGNYEKFLDDISLGKLKDEELILLHYVAETGRTKLMTGWQEHLEIDYIKDWEDIQEIENLLSRNYDMVIRKFGIRGYTETSAVTASNNPKEVKFKNEIESNILDLPTEIIEKIKSVLDKSLARSAQSQQEDLPF